MIPGARRAGDRAGPGNVRVLCVGVPDAAVTQGLGAVRGVDIAVSDLATALARLEEDLEASIHAVVASGDEASQALAQRWPLAHPERAVVSVFLVDRAKVPDVVALAASDPKVFVIDAACGDPERQQLIGLMLQNTVLTRRGLRTATVREARVARRAVSATRQLAPAARSAPGRGPSEDALTGLPGRQALHARLAAELDLVSTRRDYEFALLVVDLDRFKVVNDTFGSTRADALLIDVGRRIRDIVRSSDLVCRIGADEFGVILSDVRDRRQVTAVAQRLSSSPATLIAADGRSLPVTLAIGAVVAQRGGEQVPDDVLRKASLALSVAKARRGARVELFDPDEHARSLVELDLEPQILRAIENEEFSLFHQAVVSLADGRIHGFEGLLRWHHPKLGLVPPGAFIPMVESSGLIEPLGEWVIGRACRDLERLQRVRPASPVFLNLNLSHRQLLRTGFAERMIARVRAASIDPRLLGVELTETTMIDDFKVVGANVTELREAGLRVFVDDFGVGYSSLSSLSRLPVDVLKIDRSFVAGMASGERDVALVAKIVELGHVLDLSVVAEGVETAAEVAAVVAAGCDYAQGYYFHRPAPLADTIDLLRSEPVFGRPASVQPASAATLS